MNTFHHSLLIAACLTTSGNLACAQDPARPAPNAANSVHLQWAGPVAQEFYMEAKVQKSTVGSYFAICGWNTGYFGVQELDAGKKIAIFSVWDPTKGDDPKLVKLEDRVEVLHQGKGVQVSRFGGEGTGGKSMTPFGWQLGETIRCLVRAKVEGEKTAYSGWLWQPGQKEWQHLVTFRVRTGGKPLAGYYSFVEDFRRDTKSVTEERRALFSNGWIKMLDGRMLPLALAKFTHSQAPTEASDLIDAGLAEGGFYLANGGTTKKSREPGAQLELNPVPTEAPKDLPVEP